MYCVADVIGCVHHSDPSSVVNNNNDDETVTCREIPFEGNSAFTKTHITHVRAYSHTFVAQTIGTDQPEGQLIKIYCPLDFYGQRGDYIYIYTNGIHSLLGREKLYRRVRISRGQTPCYRGDGSCMADRKKMFFFSFLPSAIFLAVNSWPPSRDYTRENRRSRLNANKTFCPEQYVRGVGERSKS